MEALSTKVRRWPAFPFGIAGVSLPLSNYENDYLPLSIGLHSKTASVRIMAAYQLSKFFATASATYVFRNNITIDLPAYYTAEMHNTSEVRMPDASSFNLHVGYRSQWLIAEGVEVSYKNFSCNLQYSHNSKSYNDAFNTLSAPMRNRFDTCLACLGLEL